MGNGASVVETVPDQPEFRLEEAQSFLPPFDEEQFTRIQDSDGCVTREQLMEELRREIEASGLARATESKAEVVEADEKKQAGEEASVLELPASPDAGDIAQTENVGSAPIGDVGSVLEAEVEAPQADKINVQEVKEENSSVPGEETENSVKGAVTFHAMHRENAEAAAKRLAERLMKRRRAREAKKAGGITKKNALIAETMDAFINAIEEPVMENTAALQSADEKISESTPAAATSSEINLVEAVQNKERETLPVELEAAREINTDMQEQLDARPEIPTPDTDSEEIKRLKAELEAEQNKNQILESQMAKLKDPRTRYFTKKKTIYEIGGYSAEQIALMESYDWVVERHVGERGPPWSSLENPPWWGIMGYPKDRSDPHLQKPQPTERALPLSTEPPRIFGLSGGSRMSGVVETSEIKKE